MAKGRVFPKLKATLHRVWYFAVLIPAGVIIAVSIRSVADALDLFGQGNVAVFVTVYAFTLALIILIHECGHAIAAHCLGWKVHLIAVWPVAYRFRKRKLGWAPSALSDLGGMVMATPSSKNNTYKARAIYALGGPLANLSLAAPAIALASASPGYTLEATVFGGLGAASLIAGVSNLVPFKTGGGYSDGAQLIRLLAQYLRSKRKLALLARPIGARGKPGASLDSLFSIRMRAVRQGMRIYLRHPKHD